MCNLFRLLDSGDIECRVAQTGVNQKGVPWASILLYKDARVDQRILDDTFGPMNWQATYDLIDGRLYCKVSVWDSAKGCWISKQNVGTESNTEAEKGQASDALKRACFTWGLGVELYSSPKIFVSLTDRECHVEGKNVKVYPSFKLLVHEIRYDSDRKVSYLCLKDQGGTIRYEWGSKPSDGSQKGAETVFVSNDGRELRRGDERWKLALQKVRAGEQCKDGTPIPVWLADFYNVPDSGMKLFFADLKQLDK